MIESETKTINMAMQRASSVEITAVSEQRIVPEETKITMSAPDTDEMDEIRQLRSKYVF